MVDERFTALSLPVAIDTFGKGQYVDADGKEEETWALRTEVIDHSFVIVVGRLALVLEALNLDELGR